MKGEIEVLVAGREEALDDILGPRLVFLLDGVERCLADAGERIGLCAGIEFIEPANCHRLESSMSCVRATVGR